MQLAERARLDLVEAPEQPARGDAAVEPQHPHEHSDAERAAHTGHAPVPPPVGVRGLHPGYGVRSLGSGSSS